MQIRTMISRIILTAATTLLLSACAAPVTSDFRARVWERCHVSGQREYRDGRYAIAVPLFAEAVKQASGFQADDRRRMISMLLHASSLLHDGRMKQAQPVFEEVIRHARKRNDGPDATYWGVMEGRALAGLADCQRSDGRIAEAGENYKAAIEVLEKVNPTPDHGYDVAGYSMAHAYNGLSDILVSQGKVKDSVKPLSEAARIADWTVALVDWKEALHRKYVSAMWATGDHNGALSYSYQSWKEPMKSCLDALTEGDMEALKQHAGEVDSLLFGRADDPTVRAINNSYFALTEYYQGNYSKAIELAKEGLELRRKDAVLDKDLVAADLYDLMGSAEEAQGNLPIAAKHLRMACDIDSAVGLPHPMHSAMRIVKLATIELKQGNKPESERLLDRAALLSDSTGKNGAALGMLHYYLALYHQTAGNTDKAQTLTADAITRLDRRPKHILRTRAQHLLKS